MPVKLRCDAERLGVGGARDARDGHRVRLVRLRGRPQRHRVAREQRRAAQREPGHRVVREVRRLGGRRRRAERHRHRAAARRGGAGDVERRAAREARGLGRQHRAVARARHVVDRDRERRRALRAGGDRDGIAAQLGVPDSVRPPTL